MKIHNIYLGGNNLYLYALFEFFLMGGFRYIKPKEFDMNKYACNISKGCILDVVLEYPKEIYNIIIYNKNKSLAPDKRETKKETLSKYQLMIFAFYNIPIDNFQILVPKCFDKEKYVFYYESIFT